MTLDITAALTALGEREDALGLPERPAPLGVEESQRVMRLYLSGFDVDVDELLDVLDEVTAEGCESGTFLQGFLVALLAAEAAKSPATRRPGRDGLVIRVFDRDGEELPVGALLSALQDRINKSGSLR